MFQSFGCGTSKDFKNNSVQDNTGGSYRKCERTSVSSTGVDNQACRKRNSSGYHSNKNADGFENEDELEDFFMDTDDDLEDAPIEKKIKF